LTGVTSLTLLLLTDENGLNAFNFLK